MGRSIEGSTVAGVLDEAYDLGVFVGSWDRRCLCVTGMPNLRVKNIVVLHFASHDRFGLQKKHERDLKDYLKGRGSVHLVDKVSEDVEGEWNRIWTLTKQLLPAGEPIKVVVDLSTCPRFYSLGLVAGLLSIGAVSELHALYSEGEYAAAASSSNERDIPFSIGQWKNIPVPFLRGQISPAAKKYYFVSIGFEPTKTARVLSQQDPDRISVLAPIPGVLPEYDRQVRERNADIMDHFRVPVDQVIEAPAGDAIAAWRHMSRRHLERFKSEDVYYLCCGTKAHSLGMALRAFCTRIPTVLYNVPERHSFVEVSPTGKFWSHRIKDLSAPPTIPNG